MKTADMRFECIENLDDLQTLRAVWDKLAAGNLFRSWTWLATWWRHYGSSAGRRRGLRVLVAQSDEGNAPVAILPCYVETSLTCGRVWRLCGDGEVCSDHLGLLASGEHTAEAAAGFADLLTNRDDWDLLDLGGVDVDDAPTFALIASLRERGCSCAKLPSHQVWSVALSGDWDEYLMQMSKSHRKQLRRLQRSSFDSGLAKWRLVESPDQFAAAWQIFKVLHQRRRESLGEPGCFALPTWASFHEEIARLLLTEGRLRLSWLELRGKPIAAEYQFADGATTYAYQGGLDPDRLDEQPGRLSLMRTIQHSFTEGRSRIDLLRGDEPYKRHWRAEPTTTVHLQAAPARRFARWRHWGYIKGFRAGQLARQWMHNLS